MRNDDLYNSKIEEEIIKWLEDNIFSDDFLEDNYFQENNTIYEIDLGLYDSFLEAAIHCPSYAKFSPRELNDSILNACQSQNLSELSYCFNVNVHDNSYRTVGLNGIYSFVEYCRKLHPLYDILSNNRAREGGESYTGLLGIKKDWMITFTLEGDNRFIIRAHGSEEFCKQVLDNLALL